MTSVANYDLEMVEGVRRFVQKQVLGQAQSLESSQEYPQHLIDGLAQLGLFGMAVPQEFGGLGLDVPTYTKIMEELAFGWATLAGFLNSHASASSIIAKHGTAEQKQALLPRMATGQLRVAIALTEPHAGSDLQAIRTTATADDQGGYRLKGSKIFITNGARAAAVVVLARTGEGKNGISLFFVDKQKAGFSVGAAAKTLAHPHLEAVELHFENVALEAGDLIGEHTGQGLAQMLDALEVGRIAIGATAVGLARAALKCAVDYAGERVAFGQVIGQHQAVQGHLADMASKTMAAQALVTQAAMIKSQGGRCDMVAGMAKLIASETCVEVTLNCVRVFGGSGFVSDFPAERYYREATEFLLVEGSNEIQKTIIARRLLSGDAAAVGL